MKILRRAIGFLMIAIGALTMLLILPGLAGFSASFSQCPDGSDCHDAVMAAAIGAASLVFGPAMITLGLKMMKRKRGQSRI